MDLVQRGSQTAKDGFRNEDDIVIKFNNWQKDNEAKLWLEYMGYKLEDIEYVKVIKVAKAKTDVQVQITIKLKKIIDAQNIQVKLVSNNSGFNQIDKRWVDNYVELWNIPNDVSSLLKQYTGETKPTFNTKDKRRAFANEFNDQEQMKLIKWIKNNQSLIVSDILKGRGQLAAEWMLVVQKANSTTKWILNSMNYCLNFFGNGDVVITGRGSIRIGQITMQRKGGDGGRDTANMLQFKINPALLFKNEITK
ncbi:MAG: hypothetical protein LBO06_01005 [Bacteroidales bacterium]|jgi:hypothetical protein|nr:hypothetical protein [Bacteroidales bacterium]